MLFTNFIACILVAALGHAKASFLFNWGGSPCGLSATPPSSSIVTLETGEHPPAVSADSSVKASDTTTTITQGGVIRAKRPTMNFRYFGNRVLRFVGDKKNQPIIVVMVTLFATYIASITRFFKDFGLGGQLFGAVVESAPSHKVALLETFLMILSYTSAVLPEKVSNCLVMLLVVPEFTENVLLSLNAANAAGAASVATL